MDLNGILAKHGNQWSLTPLIADIAPIQQGEYLAAGGAQQVIVPNRELWTSPTKIGEIKGAK